MSAQDLGWVAPTIGWSYVRLVGKDVVKFLNNFCTADLKRLVPGQTRELMLLNPKGQVFAWGTGILGDNTLSLMLSGPTADQVIQHLDAYLFSEDVRLSPWPVRAWLIGRVPNSEDSSQMSRELVSSASETIAPILGQLVCDDSGADPSLTQSRAPWSVWQAPGGAAWLITSDKFEMSEIVDEASPWRNALSSAGPWLGHTVSDYHQWRISARVPIVGQDTTATTLPQELLRDDFAISFTKGCYLGQETVARLDAMGHVNWNLRTLTLDRDWPKDLTSPTSSAPNEEVTIRTSQQTVGQLTSMGGDKALARLRSSAVEEFQRSGGAHWQLYVNETPLPHKISQIV